MTKTHKTIAAQSASARMEFPFFSIPELTEATEYFIRCFDAVAENIGDKELDVVRINSGEVKGFAKRLERIE